MPAFVPRHPHRGNHDERRPWPFWLAVVALVIGFAVGFVVGRATF